MGGSHRNGNTLSKKDVHKIISHINNTGYLLWITN